MASTELSRMSNPELVARSITLRATLNEVEWVEGLIFIDNLLEL